jgi:hypothetical protein
LQLVVQRGASIEGMPNVPKTFADGPINMAPLKKKERKSCECTLDDLINMNHTTILPDWIQQQIAE